MAEIKPFEPGTGNSGVGKGQNPAP